MSYRDDLERRERDAIEKRERDRFADWQVKMIYYIAMLNNRAMRNGRQEINLRLVPGKPPTLVEIKKER